jgi:membrane AbrB-like protein
MRGAMTQDILSPTAARRGALVPAALLLGPMLAGIAITAGAGYRLGVPAPGFILAQGLIGCMIARMLPKMIGGAVIADWPVFLLGVLSVIAASGLLGWLMIRLRVLPGTTVLWGISPGAATAMTLMAEAYGADVQLVAFMQYLRVVLVAAVASGVATLCGAAAHHAAPAIVWFPPVHWLSLAETLALAVLGAVAAIGFKLRAGALLIPMVAGIILTHGGWMSIELPPWLLAMGYACIGWQIGLRFTRPLLFHAAKALPRILACTLALILVCAGLGALLTVLAGIDPLTAYLATSPGGADTVAIISASSHVDASFVMAMQTARFVAVLFLSPPLARLIAGRTGHTS